MNTTLLARGALAGLLAITGGSLLAQTPARTPVNPAAATIGRGWTAVASGATVEAVRIADGLLATNPRDHRALSLKIEAMAPTEPIKGLDAYERWLAQVRFEDPFLLDTVARGTLEQLASGSDTGLKVEALERLARAGMPGARERLGVVRPGTTTTASDAALARLGDADAAGRLIEQARTAEGGRAEAVADALPSAGAAAIPALRRLLANPSGPTRATALQSLGTLDARSAIADIRARLSDPDPLVRARAAVVLARMDDQQGEARVTEMLDSPVADLRLLAAEAYAGKGNGAWVGAILPLLRDPAGLTRLRAAELIAPIDPEAARAVLAEAAGDPNPVVRAEATRVLELPALTSSAPTDWPSLRKLLRDRDPAVRLHAAGIVLALVSGM